MTSPVRRTRATKEQVEERLRNIIAIVEEIEPCTLRQVFYQCVVRGILDKTESKYCQLSAWLVKARDDGLVPYESLVDNSRDTIMPQTYRSIQEALDDVADSYRRAMWDDVDEHVEIAVEKDALSGVLEEVTMRYDTPLVPGRGYTSKTLLHDTVERIEQIGKPTFIYYLGDFDPSGCDACRSYEERLRDEGLDVTFKSIAVTESQISKWRLPSNGPPNRDDPRTPGWISQYGSQRETVQLDAISPARLRSLVEKAIRRHLSDDVIAQVQATEERERERLRTLTL